jgi:hypothetical protein
MIVLGLTIHTAAGILTGDFSTLINALMFGGLLLTFGLMMYFTGQWGGGDGELLVALGVLLPTLSTVKTYFPFSISFFINSFFIGAAYSIIYSLLLSARNPSISKDFLNKVKEPLVLAPLSFFLLLSVASLFYAKYLSLVFFLIFILILFWKFAKSIERGFYKRIPSRKLKVDDMLGEDIPKLRIYKRYIKGLTKEQIVKIRKIKKYVLVREGIRYGLVFPLTLVFTLLLGDIFFLLL